MVDTVDKNGQASWYYDLEAFYTQTIAGYGGVQSGVTMQNVVTEIDAGRPLFGLLLRIDSGQWTTIGHAIAVFGYRKVMTEGQWTGLDLLTYDTWHQDSDGQHTTYSIVPFPDSTMANNPPIPASPGRVFRVVATLTPSTGSSMLSASSISTTMIGVCPRP